jgi:hypothetical protein
MHATVLHKGCFVCHHIHPPLAFRTIILHQRHLAIKYNILSHTKHTQAYSHKGPNKNGKGLLKG